MKHFPNPSSAGRAVWAAALMVLAAASAAAQPDPAFPTLPPGTRPPVAPPQPPEGFADTDSAVPDRKSERFIAKVAMLQSEEARLSVIAAQRAAHDRVRTFAQQIQAANQARDQELAQLAQRRSVLVPTGRDPNNLAEDSEEWQRKDARDFDDDYVQRIIKIQQNAIDTLEDYAKAHDSDPELSAFAEKHLPGLRENLRQAETLKKQVD